MSVRRSNQRDRAEAARIAQPINAARVVAASTAAVIEETAAAGMAALSEAVQAQIDDLDTRLQAIEP